MKKRDKEECMSHVSLVPSNFGSKGRKCVTYHYLFNYLRNQTRSKTPLPNKMKNQLTFTPSTCKNMRYSSVEVWQYVRRRGTSNNTPINAQVKENFRAQESRV